MFSVVMINDESYAVALPGNGHRLRPPPLDATTQQLSRVVSFVCRAPVETIIHQEAKGRHPRELSPRNKQQTVAPESRAQHPSTNERIFELHDCVHPAAAVALLFVFVWILFD